MSARRSLPVRFVCSWLWLGLLAACGEEDDVTIDDADASSVITVDAGEAPQGCAEGSTTSCVCSSGGIGAQTCRAGSYSGCEGCSSVPATGQSSCVAGVYRGHLDMSYGSTASGLCGIIGPLARSDYPGEFLFSLEQNGSVEFYTVGNGCFKVPPPSDPMAYDIKFRAALTGNVDCSTGELNVGVKATYGVVSLCNLGQIRDQYFAKGVMRATFNPSTQTFEQGTLRLSEPKVLIGEQPGGLGTFTAKLDPSAMLETNATDCLEGVMFPEERFADQDAGVP